MDSKERHNLRLAVLAGFLALVVLIYVGVLYDTQVVNYDKYIAQSIRSIAGRKRSPHPRHHHGPHRPGSGYQPFYLQPHL